MAWLDIYTHGVHSDIYGVQLAYGQYDANVRGNRHNYRNVRPLVRLRKLRGSRLHLGNDSLDRHLSDIRLTIQWKYVVCVSIFQYHPSFWSTVL